MWAHGKGFWGCGQGDEQLTDERFFRTLRLLLCLRFKRRICLNPK